MVVFKWGNVNVMKILWLRIVLENKKCFKKVIACLTFDLSWSRKTDHISVWIDGEIMYSVGRSGVFACEWDFLVGGRIGNQIPRKNRGVALRTGSCNEWDLRKSKSLESFEKPLRNRARFETPSEWHHRSGHTLNICYLLSKVRIALSYSIKWALIYDLKKLFHFISKLFGSSLDEIPRDILGPPLAKTIFTMLGVVLLIRSASKCRLPIF